MKKVPKIKYAVGSVAQAAAEGADSLLSEARKDVVAKQQQRVQILYCLKPVKML